MKPSATPPAVSTRNIELRPTVVSQKCPRRRRSLHHSRPVSLGHRCSIMPKIQKLNTPNITRWAWPTTQSVKWITCWKVSVTWNAHCRQVMK